MSIIPVFELGVWNAWIFMLIELLTLPFFFRIAKRRVLGFKLQMQHLTLV